MMQRREILQLVAASAMPLWMKRSASAQPRLQKYPFAYGVASGSPQADSVVLWTRLALEESLAQAGASLQVRWELAHDAQFKQLVRSGRADASAQLAYCVHVEPSGLESDRWYYYRFMLGDAVSATGRTRTFPLPGAKVTSLRLAYASCQRWEHGYYGAYRHMRAEDLDAVLFLGDYIYEYPGAANAVRMANMTSHLGFVVSLDDYRARYALYKSDADLQAMHASCPWLMTWDDHEVQNDYAGLQSGNSGVADIFSKPADFLRRRAAAYQAYYENMPIRASTLMQGLSGLTQHDSGSEMRIYQRVDYGRLATLYLLDTRQYKDPQVCTKAGSLGASTVDPAYCGAWKDTHRSMLGTSQEEWLFKQFARSSVRGSSWNVLAQSTLFGQRDNQVGLGQSFYNDGWDGYAACRTRVTDALQQSAVANPVVLGGDVHENWVGYVKADYAQADSANVGVEFCGTSISSRSRGNAHTAERLAENPHFVFAETQRRGYGVVEFTPRKISTHLRVLDDVTQADTKMETLASFTVRAGRGVIEV